MDTEVQDTDLVAGTRLLLRELATRGRQSTCRKPHLLRTTYNNKGAQSVLRPRGEGGAGMPIQSNHHTVVKLFQCCSLTGRLSQRKALVSGGWARSAVGRVPRVR